MPIGNALQELGSFLDECNQRGSVESVGLPEQVDPSQTDTIASEIQLTLTTRSNEDGTATMSLCPPSVDADGTLQLSFESVESIVPVSDYDVEVEPVDVRIETADTFVVTLFASVSTDIEPACPAADHDSVAADSTTDLSSHNPTTDGSSAADGRSVRAEDAESTATSRDSDVPPFRDPDFLEEVYESCDTFAEMTDALEMDVTAETVRRYMIDHGIHQPNSYNTNEDDLTDADSQSSVVLADGIGLPEDTSVDSLVEAVERIPSTNSNENSASIGEPPTNSSRNSTSSTSSWVDYRYRPNAK